MKRGLFVLTTMGVLLSGCFMAPLALVGPATSGFSAASVIQTAVTSTANYMVRQSTGKSINQHVLDTLKDGNAYRNTLTTTK